MRHVLLFADNDPKFRESWGKVLRKAQYDIQFAENPQQTRDILNNFQIDLAILDLRLEDDSETNDISGLTVATEAAFRAIPKIVLTGFPTSYKSLRNVLGPRIDELPPAIAFVDKAEGPDALLSVIGETLAILPHLRISTKKVTDQIKLDHQVTRQQAKLNYIAAFVVAVVGFLVIFAGIFLAWFDKLALGILGTTAGLILEALGYLFFTRLDRANDRMDVYHTELVQAYQLEVLLAACEQLPAERQIACTEQVIRTAADNWFLSSPTAQTTASARQQDVHK